MAPGGGQETRGSYWETAWEDVMTTPWKVDNRASFRLMEHFYAHLDAAGPAAALRQAQRATMTEFPHPFAWAAFGLTGMP